MWPLQHLPLPDVAPRTTVIAQMIFLCVKIVVVLVFGLSVFPSSVVRGSVASGARD